MQKRLKITTFLLSGAFALSAMFLSHTASAQSTGAVPDPVQYNVAPESPAPNTQVGIGIQGVGTFLGDATITWSENGKVVSTGVGDRNFTFTTGALGTVTHIHVEIDSDSEGTITHDWAFIPSVVNLIWEANTTVPPFFKGKALYSPGATVKVVAFPTVIYNGQRIAPSSLSYQWTLDDNPDPQNSGLGLNTYTFAGNELSEQETVSVDVSLGNLVIGHADLTIPATNPELVLYAKDALRGVLWDNALSSAITLTSPEITVLAEPYYFSNDSAANGQLTYDWTLNGNETTGPDSAQGELTLRQTGSGGGEADVGVSLTNGDTDKFMQAAQTALTILFGGTTNTTNSTPTGL